MFSKKYFKKKKSLFNILQYYAVKKREVSYYDKN